MGEKRSFYRALQQYRWLRKGYYTSNKLENKSVILQFLEGENETDQQSDGDIPANIQALLGQFEDESSSKKGCHPPNPQPLYQPHTKH